MGILEAIIQLTANDFISGGKQFSVGDVNSLPSLGAPLLCHFEERNPVSRKQLGSEIESDF